MSWEDTIRKNVFDKNPNDMTDFMNVSPRMEREAEKRTQGENRYKIERMLLDASVALGNAEKLLTELNREHKDELNSTEYMKGDRLKNSMSKLIRRSVKNISVVEKELFR
tara:strand:+ start:79 stop:408 length:330 start_codon:yes stop_codon:yes gene_type:complete